MSNPRLEDVAREVGVHPSTVSRALNPERVALVNATTRAAVAEAVRRLGYKPDMVARGLANGRTATVGIIVPDLGNPFVTPIIHQVSSALESGTILPLIADSHDSHERLADILGQMIGRRVDAIVTSAARVGDRELLESAARRVPVILAARPLPDSHLPQIVHDDERGGRIAATHLADCGHIRLAQLRGPSDVVSFQRRALGFSETCVERGLKEVTIDDEAVRPTLTEGIRLMNRLLATATVMPSGVFVHNDPMAIGAIQSLKDANLSVPGDVSIIGYNDIPMAGLVSPPLTTLRYPSREIGRSAGGFVVEALAGGKPLDVCLKPSLVQRASTACLH